MFKDLNSTVAKKGSVFIGKMTPDGADIKGLSSCDGYHISAGGHKEALKGNIPEI